MLASVVIFLFSLQIVTAVVLQNFSLTTIALGIVDPVKFAFCPDHNRILVTQKSGLIRVVKNGTLLATPLLTLPVSAYIERGLLGVACDVDPTYVYVYYTTKSPHNRISRFETSGDIAVNGSETVFLDLFPAAGSIHHGGALRFARNHLFISTGDNGMGANSQNFSNPMGKLLRVHKNGSIPTDNPFYFNTSGLNRAIWALGLRNPFSFAVNASGRIFINDVGENSWEEINDGLPGANYGWPSAEGTSTSGSGEYSNPYYSYGHGSGNNAGCAITGGTFYAPPVPSFPAAFVGAYFFADYCNGWINYVDLSKRNNATNFATGIETVVDLHVPDNGKLYFLSRGGETTDAYIGVISYTPSVPVITTQPTRSVSVLLGSPATFQVNATSERPMTFRWQRDDRFIANATSRVYTISKVALADNGATFRCIVSNSFGSIESSRATLTVRYNNTPPTAVITAPAVGSTYVGNSRILFNGSASDAQESLSAARFSWEVIFHHDFHTHPVLSGIVGNGGSFVVDVSGETAVNVSYEFKLTVTDSGGLSTTVSRRITPRVVTITLKTSRNAPLAMFTVDSIPCANPCVFKSVVGMRRSIGAPAAIPSGSSGSTSLKPFKRWNDDSFQSLSLVRAILAPSSLATYTANY